MTNLGGVVQMLKKEHDRLSKEMKAISAALSAFRAAYGKGTVCSKLSHATFRKPFPG